MGARVRASRRGSVGIIVAGCGVSAGSISWSSAPPSTVGCGGSAAAPRGALDVPVDRGQALPRIADALTSARWYVHIAG
jgi:hypothetical protein